jgi:membrane protease YdiL (CAAX protease family)
LRYGVTSGGVRHDFPAADAATTTGPRTVPLVGTVQAKLVSNRPLLLFLAVILAALASVTLANKYGPANTGIVVEPAVAMALIWMARKQGLSWHDLGLSRRTWLRGLRVACMAILAVTIVYAAALAFPLTRAAFVDGRYQLHTGAAFLTALVFIPLGTVMLEEIAFRGVLMGLLGKRKGIPMAISVSSVLFGLWHVLPSFALGANRLVSSVVGSGALATVIMVTAVVAFTALAGWLLCEVRRRSGSIIATAGLHWATNGLGVLLTSAVWSLRLA